MSTITKPRHSKRGKPPVVTPEEAASVTFDAIQVEAVAAGRTQAQWLEAATHEFFLFQVAMKILGKDDAECAADVEKGGPEMFLNLYDSAVELRKKYQAGAKVLDTVAARLLIALARHPVMAEVQP